MQLFESLICEKCDPCIWDDTQDGGSEASVKGLHTFLLGDPHKDVHDVAVPVRTRKNKNTSQNIDYYRWGCVRTVLCNDRSNGPKPKSGNRTLGGKRSPRAEWWVLTFLWL